MTACPAMESAAQGAGEPVALSESVGFEIDKDERDAYSLFENIEGFISAGVVMFNGPRYRLEYSYQDLTGIHSKSK